ncbi:MAG: HEPN domain-containing protein [Candidatus Margulisiibacteriota bacterium]
MELSDKIKHWRKQARYDLETAITMHESRRYLYTSFMCQQAIEKMLKAIYLKINKSEAPKTHNLPYLVALVDSDGLACFHLLFEQLTDYYINTRYPEYKDSLAKRVNTKTKSLVILRKSQECFQWLEQSINE